VGLVPAAYAADIAARGRRHLGRADRADTDENPALVLGAAMAALARAGRDKLTFVIEPDLAPLGAWLEQLIAESTGKQGKGIVPVDGEPLAGPGGLRRPRLRASWSAE
jgi:glucose-6-phosphate isomerase